MAKRINNKVKPQFPLVSNNSNLNSDSFPCQKYREILPLIFHIISEKFQTFSISPMQEVPKTGIPSYCHQGFKNKAS